jgi:hypothetical protein
MIVGLVMVFVFGIMVVQVVEFFHIKDFRKICRFYGPMFIVLRGPPLRNDFPLRLVLLG